MGKVDIEAAGGVVVRRRKGKLQVLVIHRPNYDDWTLPKGKLDEGETHRKAALREVAEETGFTCRTRSKLPPVRYQTSKGSKRVKYWLMRPVSGKFAPNDEVDRIKWLPPAKARKRLTFKRDKRVLRQALRRHEELTGDPKATPVGKPLTGKANPQAAKPGKKKAAGSKAGKAAKLKTVKTVKTVKDA